MKNKIFIALLLVVVSVCGMFVFAGCSGNKDTIIVQTNAYFAPFEYYKGTEIVGVDVDIMNKVGASLGKKVKFVNSEFSVVIPSVEKGKICDAGAAGITITEKRKEKVDFSIPYYTSVQYVIVGADSGIELSKNSKGEDVIMWSALAGKKIGVQLDTTGHIYADIEINGDGEVGTEDYYAGELNGTGAVCKPYDSAQLASEAIGLNIDCVIVDELPAQYIAGKNSKFKCYALYYDEETATSEEYAICVTKGNTELLNAINKVLEDLLATVDENGKNGVQVLVSNHFGLN